MPPSQETAPYYVDYEEDRGDNDGISKDCDNIKHEHNVKQDSTDDGGRDDDDDDTNDDVYNNDAYEDSETSSDLISPIDEQYTSDNKDSPYRIASNILPPVRTVKSIAIRPDTATVHRNFQRPKILPKITSTVSFSSTIITPVSDTVSIMTAGDKINTIINIATTTPFFSTTNTATVIPATSTTAALTALQFIPVPIELLVPEWNTTTEDSKLSIQHQNNTLNIRIVEQDSNNRQMIRKGLIQELKCFHYFANKFVCFKLNFHL